MGGAAESAGKPWWVVILGIVCGLALTYSLQQLTRGSRAPSPPLLQPSVKSLAQAPVDVGVGSRAGRLRKEQQELRERLRRVEQELAALVSTGIVETFPTRTLMPEPSASHSSGAAAADSKTKALSLPPPSSKSGTDPAASHRRGSLGSCKYDFKVYVYPIPASSSVLRVSEEARRNGTLHVCRKCILEQFALEYIVYDFFTTFCGRVHDPEDADFFYLPLVRDAEFRLAMQERGARFRNPSQAEEALLAALEKNDTAQWVQVFGVTDKYWRRNSGSDHILVMPAPVTNFRHETSMRGFFHYMTHLHPPIFLHLEYSKQFVLEYPVCAVRKNIMMPYPTTDPDLFNGKLVRPGTPRNFLIYYAGGLHGECMEVRQALRTVLTNSSRLPNVVPKVRSSQEQRELGFLQAKYCPIPIGDSPSSKRMYDVLNFGCVPVVLSDDLIWASSDQTGGPLNHSTFSIQIPQSVIHYSAQRSLRVFKDRKLDFGVLPSGRLVYDLLEASTREGLEFENGVYVNPLVQILRKVSSDEYNYLVENGKAAGEHYRYYKLNTSMDRIPIAVHQSPDGGAIELLAEALQQRNNYGMGKLYAECRAEMAKRHAYVARYTCDGKDTVDSLLPPKEKPKPRGKDRNKR